MISSISRPKLAKGFSYVLKTSQLAEALADARIDVAVDLLYWSPQVTGSLLEGHYWLPNANVPHPNVYVRAGSLPSALRHAAAKTMLVTALPEFIRWLEEVMEEPDGSPALAAGPYFNAIYTADGLAIADRPAYKVRR